MSDTRMLLVTYVGRRLTRKDTLGYFWQFEDNSTRGYKKNLAPALIGERWKIHENKVNGTIHVAGKLVPVRVDECAPEKNKEHERWVAEDIASHQHYVEIRLNAKLKDRQTEFDRALVPLKRLIDSLTTNTDRTAFTIKVMTELMRQRIK